MSSIFFICKNCGVKIEADESFSGGSVFCPKCNTSIEVPMTGLVKGLEIGGFVLQERLGAGGMGEVWLAQQLSMERKVALKILSPSLCKDKEFVNRFLKEVKTSAMLVHPNIVTAYDAGFDKGFHFLAVQYVRGMDLEVKIKIEKVIPEKKALLIMRGVAEGLCHAWNKYRILHRDIKPANIIIENDGTPRLMDMGISKSLMEDSSMTLTGVIVGTPCYMSPEQAKAEKKIDFRSDVYSLGATLYHMVTGCTPYDGDSTISVISKHLTDPFPPPRLRNQEVSIQCSALLEAMMEKTPEKRQQSWEEVIRDIDLVMEGRMPLCTNRKPGFIRVLGSLFSGRLDSGRTRNMLVTAGVTLLVIFAIIACAIALKKIKNKKERQAAKTPGIENARTLQQEIPKQDPGKNMENGRPAPKPVQTTVQPAKEAIIQPVAKTADAPPVVQAGTQISTPEQLKEALLKSNPGIISDKSWIKIEDGKWKMDLKMQGLTDISPLAGLPISGLSLYGTSVTDISPIKGAPISFLNLSGLKLVDYSPLRGMPLDVLTLMGSSIRDLSVINKDTIRNLLITYSPVEDLSPLKGAKLSKLWLTNTKVSDLSPLKGMPLRELDIDGTSVRDLSALRGMNLETLVFTPSNFAPKDLYMLHEEMKSLKYIGTSHSDVAMNKQTAEEFWKKLKEGKIKGAGGQGQERNSPPPPIRR